MKAGGMGRRTRGIVTLEVGLQLDLFTARGLTSALPKMLLEIFMPVNSSIFPR